MLVFVLCRIVLHRIVSEGDVSGASVLSLSWPHCGWRCCVVRAGWTECERGEIISTLDPRLQLSYFELQDVCCVV